jgi:hypothetical protein
LIQTVCAVVATADVSAKVTFGFTVIVPFNVITPHPPVVVTEYAKGEPVVLVGEPEIVTVEPETVAVTPAGKPVTVAPVAPPPKVYTILVIAVLIQTVCAVVAAAEVNDKVTPGFTVIVPDKDCELQPPVVVTVYEKGEPVVVVGEPEIVTIEPETVAVTPAGKPDTLAPVAPPPIL